MKLHRFEMERWQSTHEHGVRFNLSESGVEPVSLGEFLAEEDLKALLRSSLGYAETKGSEDLRRAIADLYAGCGPENVLVTTGTAEANLLVALHTVDRGSRVVTILPNYMQMWGLAASIGREVGVLRLREERGWQPDEEDVKEEVHRKTDVISFSNPNNPTGACLSGESRGAILDAAREADAWILSDEVFRGAERQGGLTDTLWGEYEKVLVTSSLSKAFGLPGLRLGWICGPEDAIEELWSLHDYTTIALSKIVEALGTLALVRWRDKLLSRARGFIRGNFPLIQAFVEGSGLAWIPPRAGAIAFIRYPSRIPSEDLAKRALDKDVLVVPGVHFQDEGYLRVGFGMETGMLEGGLELLEALFQEVPGP
ncbi:MAG: aminotransferase class I/II-fold pyridoxal phosphate-dependent enzyme [Thermoplasmata archaeon]